MNSTTRTQLINCNNTLLSLLLSELADESSSRQRRCHVSPYLKERNTKGRFSTDFEDICKDKNLFAENFHMSLETFNKLYDMVLPYLMPKKIIRKDVIPPKAKLAIVLEFLASGCLQRHISSCYRISKQHFGDIIDQVCDAIIANLSSEIVQWTTENIKTIAASFEKKCNLRNCVGALDGKHVAIKAPPNSGSLFYNYKGYFSIVIMAVCDPDCRFTYLDVGAYGSEGDANVFRKSNFGGTVLQDRLPFPEDHDVGGIKLPLFIAADDAFPLCKRIMKPYGGKRLSPDERVFNYRLSRARITIEHTFGIISWRWLCLQKKLFCKPDRAQKIVTTCCLLHNFLMSTDNAIYTQNISESSLSGAQQLTSITSSSGRSSDYAKFIRNTMKDFVNSPSGSVSWQAKAAGVI